MMKYAWLNRTQKNPMISAASAAATGPASNASGMPTPRCFTRRPVAYPPTAKKAAWPSESMPA